MHARCSPYLSEHSIFMDNVHEWAQRMILAHVKKGHGGRGGGIDSQVKHMNLERA